MKLVQFGSPSAPTSGLVTGGLVIDLGAMFHDSQQGPIADRPIGLPVPFAEFARRSRSQITDLVDATIAGQEPGRDGWIVGPVEEIELLPPVSQPSKILCVGLNYHDHVEELGLSVPNRPHAFAKLPSALIGPSGTIRYPVGVAESIDYEVELAIVLARDARFVSASEARDCILGYTVANDISARDWQFADDDQLTLGKGFDTFFPLGPWIVTPDELEPLEQRAIRCWVNDELRQDESLGTMVFDPAEIISILSTVCTLRAGDVIATGTPAGVGLGYSPPAFLEPGDTVTSHIDGIGTLRNHVAAD